MSFQQVHLNTLLPLNRKPSVFPFKKCVSVIEKFHCSMYGPGYTMLAWDMAKLKATKSQISNSTTSKVHGVPNSLSIWDHMPAMEMIVKFSMSIQRSLSSANKFT